MAIFSKKGSNLMRDVRERRERERATKDKFNMAGTVIGNILGVKKEEEAPEEEVEVGPDGKVQSVRKRQQAVQDDAFSLGTPPVPGQQQRMQPTPADTQHGTRTIV